jgi:RimJ/RimL family protein N-acetyltransferase
MGRASDRQLGEQNGSVTLAAAKQFETPRLLVRPLAPSDLDAAFEVYASNPDYLRLTEGSAGEPGLYDRAMLERDLTIAEMTPGRQMAGISLKETGELLGVMDWMEENPSDEHPWIGLLMIRADRQRQGFARETFEGLAEQLRGSGKLAVRAGVIARDQVGRALAERLGFREISTTSQRMASQETVLVCECDFRSGGNETKPGTSVARDA